MRRQRIYRLAVPRHFSTEGRQRLLPLIEKDGWYFHKDWKMCWIEYNGVGYASDS